LEERLERSKNNQKTLRVQNEAYLETIEKQKLLIAKYVPERFDSAIHSIEEPLSSQEINNQNTIKSDYNYNIQTSQTKIQSSMNLNPSSSSSASGTPRVTVIVTSPGSPAEILHSEIQSKHDLNGVNTGLSSNSNSNNGSSVATIPNTTVRPTSLKTIPIEGLVQQTPSNTHNVHPISSSTYISQQIPSSHITPVSPNINGSNLVGKPVIPSTTITNNSNNNLANSGIPITSADTTLMHNSVNTTRKNSIGSESTLLNPRHDDLDILAHSTSMAIPRNVTASTGTKPENIQREKQ
jgi:hypothetical protein